MNLLTGSLGAYLTSTRVKGILRGNFPMRIDHQHGVDMPIQFFGELEDEAGNEQRVLLCVDADRPTEAMLHWWTDKTPGAAVLTDVREDRDHLILQVKGIYRSGAGGGLYPPAAHELTEAERKLFTAVAKIRKKQFSGTWTVENSTPRKLELHFNRQAKSPVSITTCNSWSDFKKWSDEIRESKEYVWFRGQGDSRFRLKTTLHRAGRSRLERYCSEELRTFRAHAEAQLGLRLNMADAEDYSVVLGLAQHHGLPTPLLDWTASPYIAAFFGCSDALENRKFRPDATYIRVYALARQFIDKTSPANISVAATQPYVSCLAITPRNNNRLYMQQGHFMVSNIVEIEDFLIWAQEIGYGQTIKAADIPVRSAVEALEDLAFMGLNAATLFPGLDGVGKMVRHTMALQGHSAVFDAVSEEASPRKRSSSIPGRSTRASKTKPATRGRKTL